MKFQNNPFSRFYVFPSMTGGAQVTQLTGELPGKLPKTGRIRVFYQCYNLTQILIELFLENMYRSVAGGDFSTRECFQKTLYFFIILFYSSLLFENFIKYDIMEFHVIFQI